MPTLVIIIIAVALVFDFMNGRNDAATVGKGIIESSVINEYVILTALVSAIIWVYTCQRYGLPNSVSHALIGGLIGPALLIGGKRLSAVRWGVASNIVKA